MDSVVDHPAIAIVGISFELPGVTDWNTVTELFGSGRTALGKIPSKRVRDTSLSCTDRTREGGWIDDITSFDHHYFHVSRAEAELIDPRQRRMLQLAVSAIGNAGYAPEEFRGSATGVLVAAYGAPHPSLYNLLTERGRADGLAITGSLHACAAGRVSYHLDLRGPALVIDTACSSFLVALHEARWKLLRGECDAVLVGGYELALGPPPERVAAGDGLGVFSPTDSCRPFDAAADGTAYGEGGGFVLVKRATDAERDGDTVHAVVLGSAVNHDAGRSGNLTAPSPLAQTEVIEAAWRDAAVDPATIEYVEAHGTGTKIGDPIEIRGLAQALASLGAAGSRCTISSVKANVGHLGSMAGLAGLVRVIAQFRADEIFPTASFRNPNPLMDLDGSGLTVSDHRRPWPRRPAAPRRAGISGFGLSGTNAHLVLEEGPAVPPPGSEAPTAAPEHVVVVSAGNATALRALVAALRTRVAQDPAGFDLAAAAEVLTVGREHFAHRAAWAVRHAGDLLSSWDRYLVAPPPESPRRTPVVVGLSGGHDITAPELDAVARRYPGVARVLASVAERRPDGGWGSRQLALLRLVGLCTTLTDFGVTPAGVLAHDVGVLAARVVSGDTDLPAALAAVAGPNAPAAPATPERTADALARFGSHVTLLDLSPGAALPVGGTGSGPPTTRVTFVSSIPAALCLLYEQGYRIDWRTGQGLAAPRRRVELPLAAPQADSCWPETALSVSSSAERDPTSAGAGCPTEAEDVDDVVLGFAREVLKDPELGRDDDFFEHGGSSLNGIRLVVRLNEHFGTDLSVLDLYDFPTLGDLADSLPIGLETVPDGEQQDAVRQPDGPDEGSPLSGQQLAIWAAVQMAPQSSAYNVPAALLLDRAVDVAWLDGLLSAVVARHPMLRTVLRDGVDGPRQAVLPAGRVSVDEREADLSDTTAAAGRHRLRDRLKAIAGEPLSPYGAPPVRFVLVHARFSDSTQDALVMVFHHLFFDGWSWNILWADLAGAGAEPPPARTYLDHVRDQRLALTDERGARLRRFWSEYLRGAGPVVLPTSHAAPADAALDLVGAQLPIDLDEHLVDRLTGVARRERVTLNMVLLAAWTVLLWQIGGERDICVAIPVAHRTPGDEPVIGCFANTVAVRVHLQPGEPLAALLAGVRDAVLPALAHQDLPSDRILQIARPNTVAPIASTMLGFQDGTVPITQLGPDGPLVDLVDVDPPDPTFQLNISFLMYEGTVQAHLRYASRLFRRDVAQRWADDYAAVLRRLSVQGTAVDLYTLAGSAAHEAHATAAPDFTF